MDTSLSVMQTKRRRALSEKDIEREKANDETLERMKQSEILWTDVQYAHEIFEDFDKFTLLHAGPPITWEKMSGPMKGAIAAALIYEELAKNPTEAFELASSGKVKFKPCHDHGAVGPMTGITSYSMPLYVVENQTFGNKAYSTINEGAGDVIRFGAFSDNTIKRLNWIEEVLAPAFKQTIQAMGGLDLNYLISQAVQMGDELHMRNGASSALFIKTILPPLMETVSDSKVLNEIVAFLTSKNDQFFLNLAMCTGKATMDAAHGIPHSSIVTAMARNGVEIGIRVSGTGNKWFTAPAAEVKGLYFSGYSEKNANPDIGDSAIMETIGLGGFAMAASPAVVKLLGAGGFQEALSYTNNMYQINWEESSRYRIPNLDFKGTPTGIDIQKIVDTNVLPVINTAIASNEAGVGMIGAGVAEAPIAMFQEAWKDLSQ